MSETARTWTPGHRKRRRRAVGVGRVLLMAAAAGLGWVLWVTRDTYSPHELIPATPPGELYIADLPAQREKLGEAAWWGMFPAGSAAQRLQELLRSDPGVPSWVLNHLFPDVAHVAMVHPENFSEVVVTTRVTRLLALLERFHGLMPGISEDAAGGLALRRVDDAGIYYAVRGRMLAASPSRRALIHALTLSREEALSAEKYAERAEAARSQGVLVGVRGAALPQLRDFVELAEATVAYDGTRVQLSARIRTAPPLTTALVPLLANAVPVELPPPLDGVAAVSLDLGLPLGELMPRLLDAAGMEMTLGEIVSAFAASQGTEAAPLMALGHLFETTGTSFTLSWTGVDVLEMVPVPEFVFWAPAETGILRSAMAELPVPPSGTPVWATYPRFDGDAGAVRLPMMGGPSIEPTFALFEEGLLLSSSRTLHERIVSAGNTLRSDAPGRANLHVVVHPLRLINAVGDLGRELAAMGLLRGFTAETWEATINEMQKAAQSVQVVSLTGLRDGEVLRVEALAILAQPEAAAAQ